jgi:threonine dehydrogenase-like Zn-dependent dehydrogenase
VVAWSRYRKTSEVKEPLGMRAAIFKGPGAVEAGERPDPVIQEPTDAVVRVVLGCVCGSDLWYYRGESPHAAGSIGHEFIGIVEQAGHAVQGIYPGDLVVAPFILNSDVSARKRSGSPPAARTAASART